MLLAAPRALLLERLQCLRTGPAMPEYGAEGSSTPAQHRHLLGGEKGEGGWVGGGLGGVCGRVLLAMMAPNFDADCKTWCPCATLATECRLRAITT